MMQLAMLCPFPVGVVRWSAPEPRCTVIVKATFGLDRDGELRLASQQRALDLDSPSAWSTDELGAASDFAPHKERVDVLLLGHAHAQAPSVAIPAAIELGDVRRAFVAVSSRPALEIPLSVAYLRGDEASMVPVRVGPLAARSPARRAHAGDHAITRDGMPLGPLGGDFDFGFFNAAPLPQQMDALPPSADILLTGLLAGAPRRVVIVPRRRPLVYLFDASERSGVALGMRCDTVVVDTDRAELSLVWRGSFDVERAPAGARLLVGYEMPGTRWSAIEQRDRLRFSWPAQVVEPPEQGSGRPPPSGSVSRDHSADDERTTVSAVPRLAGAPPRLFTATLVDATMVTQAPPLGGTPAALPFVSSPVLPFVSPAEQAAAMQPMPRVPAPPLASWFDHGDDSEMTVLRSSESARRPPPFVVATPVLVAEPPKIMSDVAPPSLVPQLPPEPSKASSEPVAPPEPEPASASPPRPPKPRPQPLLPVERYVAIRAELATGRRREVLPRHGFDVAAWKHQEKMQIEAIEAQALAGQTARAEALSRALEDAGFA